MGVIFILIVICILAAIGFLILFIWSVKSGQMEDTYTPSVRILFDENDEPAQNNTDSNISTDTNNPPIANNEADKNNID